MNFIHCETRTGNLIHEKYRNILISAGKFLTAEKLYKRKMSSKAHPVKSIGQAPQARPTLMNS